MFSSAQPGLPQRLPIWRQDSRFLDLPTRQTRSTSLPATHPPPQGQTLQNPWRENQPRRRMRRDRSCL